ncbi:hypothetical protein SAY87_016088 [Trapa incisa]|uniref:Response regulatory domain-containing protein n=1 Tax=Trapa incisa TaxID=236973 RepID=A0AAN7L5E9_9MYRT|nr:hypothetical protein SAY87_016088 [Trapa incisa]
MMNTTSSKIRNTVNSIRILVVDDYSVALFQVMDILKRWNHQVTGVTNPSEAISILGKNQGGFDLVVTDYHMPVMNGIDLQKRIHEEFGLPVIMMLEEENRVPNDEEFRVWGGLVYPETRKADGF